MEIFFVYLTIIILFNTWQWIDTRRQIAWCREEIEKTNRISKIVQISKDQQGQLSEFYKVDDIIQVFANHRAEQQKEES